ncbi:MAG: T9SS type A sorting domain-containing protein [Bacteroidetes bacterium]|nr:T9SS type A sorting domain-containing protein [Bacteroidota bacterium]
MKKLLPLLFLFFSFKIFAQTYPFAEGFEGQPNNFPPSGWGGSMKILSNHGINDYKALCARLSSAVTVDSAITPLIGPLTSQSTIIFKYRAIDYANYPSTPTNFDVGDQIELLLSTDGINYQTVYLIDLNNHNPSFNFTQKKVFITQFTGSNAYLKFRCQYGTGASFFVDIDTVQVRNDPSASGINDLSDEENILVYPNPAHDEFAVYGLQSLKGNEKSIAVYDVSGRKIFFSPLQSSIFNLQSSSWLHGVYFVEVADKTKRITRKLIIE